MTATFTRLLAAASVSVVLSGGVVACGGDDRADSGSTSGAAKPTTPASSPATTASVAAAVDAAFIRQMIPHHQGAVEMARIAERKAQHDEIKTLAAAIISAQERELTQLDALAKELDVDLTGTDAKMAADAETLGLSMDEMGMSMQHGSLDDADPFDRAFLDEMIPHHEGAIAMAQAQFSKGESLEVRELADDVISGQQREIIDMSAWREDWYPGDAEDSGGHSDHQGHGG